MTIPIPVIYFLSYLSMSTPPKTELLLVTFKESKRSLPRGATGGHPGRLACPGRSGGKGGKAVKGDGYGKGKSHKGKGKAKGADGAGGFHHGNFEKGTFGTESWWFI